MFRMYLVKSGDNQSSLSLNTYYGQASNLQMGLNTYYKQASNLNQIGLKTYYRQASNLNQNWPKHVL